MYIESISQDAHSGMKLTKKLVRRPVLYCLYVHRVFYADYQTIFTKTERGIQVVYFRTYQYLHMNARFNLQFFWQKLTSSGKIRVKSYTVEIAFSAWSLVGRHSVTSDSVCCFLSVGGGLRIRAGECGGKPYTSNCEKFTAACWQEQVKIMAVRKSHTCWTLVKDSGTPWSLCSVVRAGYPL